MDDLPDGAIDDAMAKIRDKHDHPAAQALLDEIDVPHLIDRLEGRSGGLRPSKPQAQADDGLIQYVWRMSRFHSGRDPKMPVMARGWLQEGLDERGIDAVVFGSGRRESDAGDAVIDALEDVVTVILLLMGRDPTGGAKAWDGILYG